MIKIYGNRQDLTSGQVFHGFPDEYETKIENALISFVKFELGYGGRIDSVTEHDNVVTISVKTRVLNKLDTTVFSGSKEDMKCLLQIAYLSAEIYSTCKDTLINMTINQLGPHAGMPFILSHAGPLILGEFHVKASLLCALGAQPGTENFEKLRTFKIEDLCAAWALNDYQISGIEDLL